MWRSPTTPPDETAEAGRPRRSRWLDIVNLAVSVLILAIFVRMIPLLTAGSGQSVNELAARVESLERSVAVLQMQAFAQPGGARLELSPVDSAGFQGLGRFTGFRIRNAGTEMADGIRAIVSLTGVSPAWAPALTGMEQVAVRTFPSSVVVSIRAIDATPPLTSASGSVSAGGSALELAVVALAPGQSLYIALGLPSELTFSTCAVSQGARIQASPSRFAPPIAPPASLQYDFGRQLRTQAEQRARIATFAAAAVCDNCRDPAGVAGFGLTALAAYSIVGGAPRQMDDGAVEWEATARAEYYAPPGVPNPCGADARLFGDAFAFISGAGQVYLYDLIRE